MLQVNQFVAVLAEDGVQRVGRVCSDERGATGCTRRLLRMYTEGPWGLWSIDRSQKPQEADAAQMMSIMQVSGLQPDIFCLEQEDEVGRSTGGACRNQPIVPTPAVIWGNVWGVVFKSDGALVLGKLTKVFQHSGSMACNLDCYPEIEPGRHQLQPQEQWSEPLGSVMQVRMRPVPGSAKDVPVAAKVWRFIGDRADLFRQWSRMNFEVWHAGAICTLAYVCMRWWVLLLVSLLSRPDEANRHSDNRFVALCACVHAHLGVCVHG